jgi:hypothetical protein
MDSRPLAMVLSLMAAAVLSAQEPQTEPPGQAPTGARAGTGQAAEPQP